MSQSTLSSPVSGPRPGENTWLWLTKIVTGPLLLLILGLHFTVNHYLGSMSSGLMTYDDVIRYFQNPIIVVIEILFLVTVVTHSLIGFHGILLDLHPPRNVLLMFTYLHALLGVAAVGYGVWLALTIASLGG
jgi:succinate dehydrogenase / fumarate reductase membrane anchor subunit